jgi:hypothetical protein
MKSLLFQDALARLPESALAILRSTAFGTLNRLSCPILKAVEPLAGIQLIHSVGNNIDLKEVIFLRLPDWPFSLSISPIVVSRLRKFSLLPRF